MKKLSKLLCFMIALCMVIAITIPNTADAAVKISKTKKTMYVGETFTLKVTGTSTSIKWSSSKKSVATVSSKGKVTAKYEGTAVISAKVSSKSYKCKVTVKSDATDLTGTWASDNNNGSYQKAIIDENTITIYWIFDDGDTKAIYWIGSYEAPTKSVNKYTWSSDRDKEKTDSALLASTDDSKKFTYEDGVLKYSASAMGSTTTVELKKK